MEKAEEKNLELEEIEQEEEKEIEQENVITRKTTATEIK